LVAGTGQSISRVVPFLIAFSCLSPLAHAQGIGFQAGASVDPEQFFVGSHFETGEIVPRLHLRPGIDGGFGDDVTLATINVDVLFKYDVGRAWKLYQGGGPVVAFLRFGEPEHTDVSGGVSGVFGFAHASGFFTEFRAASGGPTLKFAVGFTIR
jgi:hypothetical protein